MLKCLKTQQVESEEQIGNRDWVSSFQLDFKKRFINLLSYEFRDLEVGLCLEILDPSQMLAQGLQEKGDASSDTANLKLAQDKTKDAIGMFLNPFDLKRLDAYARNLADFHIIMDLLPWVSYLFFDQKLQNFRMSYSQCAILLGMGLQHKDVDMVSQELNIPVSQVLALFNKSIRKFNNHFKKADEAEIERSMNPKPKPGAAAKMHQQLEELQPIKKNISEEIQDEGEKYIKEIETKNMQSSEDKGLKKKKNRKQGKYNFELDDIDEKQIS